MPAPRDPALEQDRPPGWSHNPSSWWCRLPVLVLGLAGFGIATYLTLFQLDVLRHVWEPFFGDGSRYILKESAIARDLPIPDAALGAFAYLLDVILDCVGGTDRWRRLPWSVLGLGLIAAGLGLTGIFLVISQPVLFGHWCTLCLGSATCSVLTAGAVANEVLASLQHLRSVSARGHSVWRALWGLEQSDPDLAARPGH